MKFIHLFLAFIFVCYGDARESVKEYLLPNDHPLQEPLNNLFPNSKMFRSLSYFKREGFNVKIGLRQLMVGTHTAIEGYMIKKFTDKVSLNRQLENYVRRIKGARKIRKIIQERQFKHIVVPQKWLYKLKTPHNKKAYLLIAENMDVYDWDDPSGELKQLYYHMDIEVLTELCTVLHLVGGCDAFPRNQPFTHGGKIAFVDTEHVGMLKGHFIKHIVPALREELQDYAINLWRQLEHDDD